MTKRRESGEHPGRWIASMLVIGMLGCGESGDGSDRRGDPSVGTSREALAGSLFESTDGNLIVNTTGNFDWVNAPALKKTQDILDKATDNALGQGTKEDDPNVSMVTNSIPPRKSDLTRFYVANENLSGSFFLYLSWQRSNVLGSANMDFEFNKLPQSPLLNQVGYEGPVTLLRSPGDILVTFDFTNGGGTPVLGLLRWLTAGSGDLASQCYSSNSLPCWGKRVNLSQAAFADGAVNLVEVTDPILIGTQTLPRTLPALTFGEAAINLTLAGVFPANQCVNFASVSLKSRASAEFNSEVKDFIAPINANINNCGTINIHKQDDATPPAPLPNAAFTLYTDNAPLGPPNGTQTAHGVEDTATTFTCTTNASGDCSLASVPFGDYWVVETTGVPNHDPAADQHVHLDANTPNLTISLTFVNPRQFGALRVTKTGKDKRCLGPANPDATCVSAGVRKLAGALFTITNTSAQTVGTITTGADGTACLDSTNASLPTSLLIGAGTLTVTETTAPTGFLRDTVSQTVTITAKSNCGTSPPNPPSALTFTNSPLSRITVSFASEVAPGVTTATIRCTGDAQDINLVEGTPRSLVNLVPGTYSCTVVIDP